MHSAQSLTHHSSAPTYKAHELAPPRRFRFMTMQVVPGKFTAKLPSVSSDYPDAQTAKLAQSHSAYIRRKVKSMQDFRQALAPIARSTFENILDNCGTALGRMKDRTVKLINVVCRYTGLNFLINGLNERLYSRADVIRAQSYARSQPQVQYVLRKTLSRRGTQLPVQPTTTAYIKCSGHSDYDLDSVDSMSARDAAARIALVHREKMLRNIERIEAERAVRDHELRVNIFNKRNARKALAAAYNNAAAASPGSLINLPGAAAFSFKPQPVTPEISRAKANMDAIMAKRAKVQHRKNRQNAAIRRARREAAEAATAQDQQRPCCFTVSPLSIDSASTY